MYARCQLTSYGSFFLDLKEGIEPSFCVSAQWKMSWYSRGLSSLVAMMYWLTLCSLGVYCYRTRSLKRRDSRVLTRMYDESSGDER
jgi:hypothetical protein